MISTKLSFEDVQEACQKFQLVFHGMKNVGQQGVCDSCLVGEFSQTIMEPRLLRDDSRTPWHPNFSSLITSALFLFKLKKVANYFLS